MNNLAILFFCQVVAVTGSVLMVTLGGIVGAQLSPAPALATLPLTLMVVGAALGTIPAGWVMKVIGRPRGFALAKALAAMACACAAFALAQRSFVLWTCAAGTFGLNLAFVQQYRFAAAESVRASRMSQAISMVLLGSIGGALLGPKLAVWGRYWLDWGDYTGALLALTGLFAFSSMLLLGLRMPESADASRAGTSFFSVHNLRTRPVYWVAVLGGITAYGVMTLVMTATPLSMHVVQGHDITDVAWVIQSHVIAMYAPSLVSGWLIGRFGARRLMGAGGLILLGALMAAFRGQAVVHYWWALVLLGLGWNFLYVGSTTLLTQTYHRGERFQAQALNDFSVFGSSALASLLAGAILHYFGWSRLVLAALPVVLLMLAALQAIRHRPSGGLSELS